MKQKEKKFKPFPNTPELMRNENQLFDNSIYNQNPINKIKQIIDWKE